MSPAFSHRTKSIPTIVRIIINQATRLRAQGGITESLFAEQIRRLEREELEPKDLSLLMRDLPGGRTRFLIKEQATGQVCDLLEFAADGTPVAEREAVLAHAASDGAEHS